ncbi:alpha/beta hydrolase family protein [Qipengyuania mesophila]|uniref:alpha/beta hydrolase family protein n=1 Tax=Qipengyuania mesophila TaxID=2867246 RepID=UPI0035118DD6
MNFVKVFCAVVLAAASPAFAQEGNGPTEAVSQLAVENAEIPVSAFSTRSDFGTAMLSPKGTRFAFVHRSDGEAKVVLMDSDTLEPIHTIRTGEKYGFNWFRWAGEDRILMSIEATTSFFGMPIPISRLVVFDIPTQKATAIGFRKQGMEGDDVLYIDPYGRFIILSMSESLFEQPDVWRYPLDGSGEDGAVKVQKRDRLVDEWFADDQGTVRMGVGWTRGDATIIHYRSAPGEDLRRVTKLKRDAEELDNWDILGIYAGSDTGYAMMKGADGRQVLREFDYATGEPGPLIHQQPGWDVDSVLFNDRELVGIRYTDDERQTVWFDEEMAAHQKALEQALPGSRISIASRAGTERMLVMQYGASDPGALYVFTPAQRSLKMIAALRPEIDHTRMSEVRAIEYAARDGTPIRAYLTLPRGREAHDLPLVVLPHGGPYGIRDTLRYDDWPQLLASRGYAVLQPNFRGSGGYGEAFEELGDGQIGRRMQDDLDDAMDWAVAKGFVDPGRVCMVGASYGGYAALWGVIRNPERYRCAASFAGVTDFNAQIKYSGKYMERRYRKDFRRKVKGEGDAEIDLDDVSPASQIHRLTRPVLLVHGNEDTRVPFSQFETMVEAAEKAGKTLETLELEDNHNLAKEESERAWLEALVAFLAQHNPPD